MQAWMPEHVPAPRRYDYRLIWRSAASCRLASAIPAAQRSWLALIPHTLMALLFLWLIVTIIRQALS